MVTKRWITEGYGVSLRSGHLRLRNRNSDNDPFVVSSGHFAVSDSILVCSKARQESEPYLASTPQASLNCLRSRSSTTTSTAEATTELGLELARGTTLGLLALVAAAVAVTVTATVTTVATTSTAAATTALTVVTTEHTPGRSRALLLDVCLGHDLGGKVEPLAEVVETLGGEGVVVPLPAEAGLDEAAGGQRLASLTERGQQMQGLPWKTDTHTT